MTAVHRGSDGEPFAVTVHPRANVRIRVEENSVLAIEFAHDWKPPVTVILSHAVAAKTAITLISCALAGEWTPPANQGKSGPRTGEEVPPALPEPDDQIPRRRRW
ncbi:hypothetical protein BJ970_002093 [Saccharopolyspora phatthalungensis]|uniref:Uncharacterized protein n=1 Tax=Saccharopolyspora phatthalungensis TaxID=664693 RepID=A0A840Q7D4_9PSEU|nr:hypothetical protein [Saccharopolyspora phatthalungensis]